MSGYGKDLGGKYTRVWLFAEYRRKEERRVRNDSQISGPKSTEGRQQEFYFEHAELSRIHVVVLNRQVFFELELTREVWTEDINVR